MFVCPKDFKIFMFEPLPVYKGRLTEFAKMVGATFINKAVWTYDGEIKFGVFENTASSTIRKDKKGFEQAKIIKVPCIDFANWLSQFKKIEDFIVVKMNIEGCETDVLRHLRKTGKIDWIDLLLIEWHEGKHSEKYEKEITKLKKEIKWTFWRRKTFY